MAVKNTETAVQKTSPLPPPTMVIDYGGDAGAGFENQSQSDMLIPRLVVFVQQDRVDVERLDQLIAVGCVILAELAGLGDSLPDNRGFRGVLPCHAAALLAGHPFVPEVLRGGRHEHHTLGATDRGLRDRVPEHSWAAVLAITALRAECLEHNQPGDEHVALGLVLEARAHIATVVDDHCWRGEGG